MTKATFLMTTFNSSSTVADAVQSVLDQSFSDFNLLIVDDASTDNTVQIINSFKDSRIKLVCNSENLYIPDAANIGLQLIESPYILRIDSDDICMPYRLEKQLEFMEQHPEIGVCGSWSEFFGDNNSIWKMPCNDEHIKAYLLFNNCFANSSVIIRKNVLQVHQLQYRSTYLHPPMEDYDLWMRMMKHTRFANLPEVLAKIRSHKNSMTAKYASQSSQLLPRFFSEHLPLLGVMLHQNEYELHSLFTQNLRVGEVSPEQALPYFKNLLQQLSKNNFTSEAALSIICLKKWMLLAEKISVLDIGSVKRFAKYTTELFGEKQMTYFLKKKIRQALPW